MTGWGWGAIAAAVGLVWMVATWKGAYVLATASTKNQELLRELGVDVTWEQVAAIAEKHGVEAPLVGATIESGMEIRQRGNTLGSWDIAALRAAHEGALEAHVR